MSDDADELFLPNSRILSLLPSLASGLILRTPFTDKIYDFLEKQSKKALRNGDKDRAKDLDRIHEALKARQDEGFIMLKKSSTIDKDKTVILSYSFGNVYLEALRLATGHAVKLDYFVKDGQGSEFDCKTLKELARTYLMGNANQDTRNSIFVKVTDNPVEETVVYSEPSDFLELRRLLAEIGYTVKLDTKELEKIPPSATHEGTSTHPPPVQGPYHYVDVYSWHCTCEQFFECYNNDPTVPGVELLQDFSSNVSRGPLHKYLAVCGVLHVNPLHICSHLLAIVLCAYNIDAVDIKVGIITSATQLIEALGIQQ